MSASSPRSLSPSSRSFFCLPSPLSPMEPAESSPGDLGASSLAPLLSREEPPVPQGRRRDPRAWSPFPRFHFLCAGGKGRRDEAVLRTPRAQPAWLPEEKPGEANPWLVMPSQAPPLREVTNVENGLEEIRREFERKYGPWIKQRLSEKNRKITFESVKVSAAHESRFMARCLELAERGVYPRLMFHCRAEASPFLASKTTPRPEVCTTEDPVRSLASVSETMFACAVLDVERLEDPREAEGSTAPPPPPPAKPVRVPGLPMEHQIGRHQHRPTRRPSSRKAPTSLSSPPPPRRKAPVSHHIDGLVVFDEQYFCPLFAVRWEKLPKAEATPPPPLPKSNPNWEEGEPSSRTQYQFAGECRGYQQCFSEKKAYQRAVRRSGDVRLRGQRDKRATFDTLQVS